MTHRALLKNAAFISSYMEGLYDNEIAAKWGITTGTAKKYRARLRHMGHEIPHLKRRPRGKSDKPRKRYAKTRRPYIGKGKSRAIICKCPHCDALHEVQYGYQPIVMPRIYCPACLWCRELTEVEAYATGRYWEARG